jgi:hypothetical protein
VVAAVIVLAAIGVGAFILLRSGPGSPAASSTPSSAPSSVPTTAATTAPQSEPQSEPEREPTSAPTRESSSEVPSPSADDGIPPARVPPTGLGDDPVLDRLAQGCYAGVMQACDELYRTSEKDSDYELYGGTCAGRQDVSAADTVYCVNAFPGA